jgi:hypothetical protein
MIISMDRGQYMAKIWVAAGLLIFSLYGGFILFVGSRYSPVFDKWKFEKSGSYGDSFGPLTALMSTLAAVSAYLAYTAQRTELQRLKISAEQDAKRVEVRDFEETFFKMLTLHRDVLKAIDVKQGEKTIVGADALSVILNGLHWFLSETKLMQDRYTDLYKDHQNDLGHYFRLSYHIVKMIDDHSVVDKMKYIRIFRATLSNPEMILIGLTCAYGAGSTRFKPLVARYALLHNISASDAREYGLTTQLPEESFGDRTVSSDGILSS